MKKSQITFILISLVCINIYNSLQAQTLTQFQEDYLFQTDPKTYYSFKSAESIWQEGVQLVDYMSQSLEKNRSLTSSSNPAALIADFNTKMTNIEALKSDLATKGFEQSFNTGYQAGNKFNDGDIEGGAMDLLGGIAASRERAEAEREMERQQQALKQELNKKMGKIYDNAQMSANKEKGEFYKMAAYSFNVKEEEYYLKFVDNLNCFQNSMKNNYSTSSSSWLQNNCPYPTSKPTVIENNFVGKDIQYADAAKRKYTLYKSNGNYHFIIAARSFMSAAIKENSKAEYYKNLISYYDPKKEAFEVLALSNAYKKKHSANFSSDDLSKLNLSKQHLVNDFVTAIKNNNKGLIKLYLNRGIDKYVSSGAKKTPIRLAVENDSPDAVQLILNKQLENKPEASKQAVLQRTILMAAALNSFKTIQRFVDLGVNTEFQIKEYTPVSIANKTKSEEALNILLANSNDKSKYADLIANSISYQKQILIDNCKIGNYSNASDNLKQLTPKKRKELILSLKDELIINPLPIIAFNDNSGVTEIIDTELRSMFNELFMVNAVFNISDVSIYFLKNHLVDFNDVMNASVDSIQNIFTNYEIKYNNDKYNRSKNNINFNGSYKDILLLKQLEYYYLSEEYKYTYFKSFSINDKIEKLETRINKHKSSSDLFIDYDNVWFLNSYFFNDIYYCNYRYFYETGYGMDDNTLRYPDYPQMISRVLNTERIPNIVWSNQSKKNLNSHTFYSLEDIVKAMNLEGRKMSGAEMALVIKAKKGTKNNLSNNTNSSSISLLDYILLKRENSLIEFINDNYTINWNEYTYTNRPRFLLLALTMNWEELNNVYSKDAFDITLTDNNGNNILHYLAEYYWLFRNAKGNSKLPDKLFPSLFVNQDYKSITLKTNSDKLTPYKLWEQSRKGDIWAKWFEEKMSLYLK